MWAILLTLSTAGTTTVTATAAKADPISYTLRDAALSATFGAAAADFAVLSELKSLPNGVSVIDPDGTSSPIWRASFVGPGKGTASIDAHVAKCASVGASAASNTSVTFDWVDCSVHMPPAPAPPAPGPATWQQHTASNCAGQCLPGHSSGPKGGNCDRLPGCGHDAGLPYCDVEVMKARCANVSGCTEFNTNGYLYGKSTAITPFSAYPLECWTLGGSGPAVPAFVNVTLALTLDAGLLAYDISFQSNGSLSLWDYTLMLSNVVAPGGAAAKTALSSSARQMTGLWDSDGTADAVYFAAHDPKHVVKTCGAAIAGGKTGTLHCTVDALDATLPLYKYSAAFPLVATVLPRGDWWDITQVYRAWLLPNALWMKLGPLDGRTDMPAWLEDITLWVNNNWGGDPLGPNYGGDPEHVKLEMLRVNEKLNLTASHGAHLALHWYEWDTLGYALGSNHTKCDRTNAPCGFDTHYPNVRSPPAMRAVPGQ